MSALKRKIIRGATVLKAMKISNLDKREEVFEGMMSENVELHKKFKAGETEHYLKVPGYLIPILEDGYKRQNTMLVCMYVCGVRRLDLTLFKINEMFDVKYKTLAEAKNKLFEWCWDDLGFNCVDIKVGRRISGYKITPNTGKIKLLEKQSLQM